MTKQAHLFENCPNLIHMPLVHQYSEYSLCDIITISPIITDYRSLVYIFMSWIQNNSTGTVINTTISHDDNTLLMIGVHILGEFYFYCFHIFCFSLELYFASQNNNDHIVVNKWKEWHSHGIDHLQQFNNLSFGVILGGNIEFINVIW